MLRRLPSTHPPSVSTTLTTHLPFMPPKMSLRITTCSIPRVDTHYYKQLPYVSGRWFLRLLLWVAAALAARGELAVETGPPCDCLLLNSTLSPLCPSGQVTLLLEHTKCVLPRDFFTCQAHIYGAALVPSGTLTHMMSAMGSFACMSCDSPIALLFGAQESWPPSGIIFICLPVAFMIDSPSQVRIP